MRYIILLTLSLNSCILFAQSAEDAAKFNEVRFALEKQGDCEIANQILNEMRKSSKNDPLYAFYKMKIFGSSNCPVNRNTDSAIYYTEEYLNFFPSNMELQKQLVELKYKKRQQEEEEKQDSVERIKIIRDYLNYKEKLFIKASGYYQHFKDIVDLYDTLRIEVRGDKIYLTFSNYLSVFDKRSRLNDRNHAIPPRVMYSAVIDFPDKFDTPNNSIVFDTKLILSKVENGVPDKKGNLKPIELQEIIPEVKGTIYINKSHDVDIYADIYYVIWVYDYSYILEYKPDEESNMGGHFKYTEMGFKSQN